MNIGKITFICALLLSTSQFVYGQGRAVSVTFDDLPGTHGDINQLRYVNEKLLEILGSEDIPAIGFVNESKLYFSGKPDTTLVTYLSKWLESGFELGNHTYSHVFINQTPIEEYKEEVLKGEKIIRPLIEKRGGKLRYFRHTQLRTGPTEEYRQNLNRFLKEEGYTVAPVTIDNDEYIYAYCYNKAHEQEDQAKKEWIRKDYLRYMETIFVYYEHLSKEFLGYEPKQILLLHANLLNADTLPQLVQMLRSRNYSFVSLENALADDAYDLPVVQSDRGLSWIHRWMIAKDLKPPEQPEVSQRIGKLFEEYRG